VIASGIALAVASMGVLQARGVAREAELDLASRAKDSLARISGTLEVQGLAAPAEVIRDRWGIPHIYARSEDDLFFAQGYVQAQDRLFQMELWRRQTQGRLAELLGPDWVDRDRLTRLVARPRGDLDVEWASYGPGMRRVAQRFVAGINAYVDGLRNRPPLEFALAGLLPEHWSPEDLLARAEAFGMSGNARNEVARARLVHRFGRKTAGLLRPPDPLVDWDAHHPDLPCPVQLRRVRVQGPFSLPIVEDARRRAPPKRPASKTTLSRGEA
jgi:penicillin G amidase